jgi:hypothetical protein
MAAFESAALLEPGVEMAAFAAAAAASKCRRTVARSNLSSRAMCRRDHPCLDSVKIDCCSFTLRWFIAPRCGFRLTQRNESVHLEVAAFDSTLTGCI